MNPWTFKWLAEVSPKLVNKVAGNYTKRYKAIPWDKLMQMERMEILSSIATARRKPKTKKVYNLINDIV
jgi:hypothetical protein